MLLGEYSYHMDEKGRCPIPGKFREIMGKKVIVAQGLDGRYLAIYQKDDFEALYFGSKESLISRRLRLIASTAEDLKLDKQGRIRISAKLRSFAFLEKGEVIILGSFDHLEVWNPRIWKSLKKRKKVNLVERRS